jgi:predicted MPP superfamily phosphohydrolase
MDASAWKANMNEEEQNIEKEEEPSGLMSRRKFLHLGIIGASVLAAGGSAAGIATRNNIQITKKTFAIANLPQSWKGTTITFASDIHAGAYMSEADMKNIVHIINSMKSDIVVLPGDFVTSHRNEIPSIVEAFSGLEAPLGKFATTGNHEFYVDADLVSEAIESCDIKMLRNDNVALDKNGEKLFILGVDDINADQIIPFTEGKKADHIEATYRGVPDKAATILLNHKPYLFDEYAQTNAGLMLSGHTHGGQIVFARFGEMNLSFSRIASKYVEGTYTKDVNGITRQMYVSRGLGTVALPMRLNCPPEITQITLA